MPEHQEQGCAVDLDHPEGLLEIDERPQQQADDEYDNLEVTPVIYF